MDGVICHEDVAAYNQIIADTKGNTRMYALWEHFKKLEPNEDVCKQLKPYSNWLDFYVVSARAFAGVEGGRNMGKFSIHNWLLRHLGPHWMDDRIRVSPYRFKLFHTCDLKVMIDNDALNLSRLPLIDRYAYNPFYRSGDPSKINQRLTIVKPGQAGEMFEKILDKHYPPMVF